MLRALPARAGPSVAHRRLVEAWQKRRGWFFGRSLAAQAARAMLLPILVPAGLVLVLLLMPVFVSVAACQLEQNCRHRRAALAAVTPCTRCDAVLGPAAEALADKEWGGHMTALHEEHSGSRLRAVRRVWAVCVACGAHLGFDEPRRISTPLPEPPDRAPIA